MGFSNDECGFTVKASGVRIALLEAEPKGLVQYVSANGRTELEIHMRNERFTWKTSQCVLKKG
jgi:hypothetical protein